MRYFNIRIRIEPLCYMTSEEYHARYNTPREAIAHAQTMLDNIDEAQHAEVWCTEATIHGGEPTRLYYERKWP